MSRHRLIAKTLDVETNATSRGSSHCSNSIGEIDGCHRHWRRRQFAFRSPRSSGDFINFPRFDWHRRRLSQTHFVHFIRTFLLLDDCSVLRLSSTNDDGDKNNNNVKCKLRLAFSKAITATFAVINRLNELNKRTKLSRWRIAANKFEIGLGGWCIMHANCDGTTGLCWLGKLYTGR